MKKITIAGFVSSSFVDWPGKIASVIFLGGCNFACHYCHNHHIMNESSNTVEFDEALEQIKERKGFIDGVVISGGEPTLHKDLETIIKTIKQLGLPVKLDTNGTNSALLQSLSERGLVDFVAMDFKAPLARYKDIVRIDNEEMIKEVERSIEYLKSQNKIEYMYRLTLSPLLGDEDIKEMAKQIDGAKCLQLQQFVPNSFSNSAKVVCLPHTKETAERYALLFAKYVNSVVLKGF